jgi:hypothetical protein
MLITFKALFTLIKANRYFITVVPVLPPMTAIAIIMAIMTSTTIISEISRVILKPRLGLGSLTTVLLFGNSLKNV